MRTHDGSPTRKALPMLLGLTLVGWAGATPVFAQDTANTPDTAATSAPMPPNDLTRDETARAVLGDNVDMQDPDAIPDPMPLNYPYAAPGGLLLRHWTDYTKMETRPGSVEDVRYYKDKMSRIDLDDNGRVKNSRDTMRYYRRASMPDQQDISSPGYDRRTSYYERDFSPRMMMGAMASSGDFLYIVRDNTLYQWRAADMSLVTQKDLPMTGMSDTGAASSTSTSGTTSDQSISGTYTQTSSRMIMRPASIAVNGDNIFILRGNTLWQFKASDLSLVSQKDLPMIGAGSSTGTGTSGQSTSPAAPNTGTGTNGTGTTATPGTSGTNNTAPSPDTNTTPGNTGTNGTDTNSNTNQNNNGTDNSNQNNTNGSDNSTNPNGTNDSSR